MEMTGFFFKGFAICIVILASSICQVASQDDGSPLRFFDVFTKCLHEENLPTLASDSNILEILNSISQAKGIFDRFMDCLTRKKIDNRNSTDSTEWYLARVFDKSYAAMYWPLYERISTSGNFTCLVGSGRLNAVENCLVNVTQDIAAVRQKIGTQIDTSSDSDFKRTICSELESAKKSTPDNCFLMLNASECSREVEQFVLSYMMIISCNNNYNSSKTTTTTTKMPTPFTQYSTAFSTGIVYPSPSPPQVAFFSCLSIVYPGEDFRLLFPPSESTLRFINNVTTAQLEHEMDVDNFCSKVNQYSQCVELKLSNPSSPIDYVLKSYMDASNVKTILNEYCANRQLIQANFGCTYRSVMVDSSCRGGMNDVITDILNGPIAQMWTLCVKFKKTRECRINKQLLTCNKQFASVMENVLTGALNEKCKAGEVIFPENQMTDLLPCVAKYMTGLLERVPSGFGNPKQPPKVNEIVEFILEEAAEMCRSKESIFSCFTRTLKTSTKTIDRYITEMFSIKNMLKILDFNCEILSDLKKHSPCIIKNLEFSSQNFTSCAAAEGEAFAAIMANASNAEDSKDRFCRGMGSALKCYIPIISMCDQSLVTKFQKLMDGTRNSCNNPSYTLNFDSPPNTSSHQVAVPAVLLISFVWRYFIQ